MTPEQGDLFARAARDEALERVLEPNEDWQTRCLAAIQRLTWAHDFTGEDLRLHLIETVGRPHHHNAWGALVRNAVSQDLIRATGLWRPMRTKRSHTRRTPVYYRPHPRRTP